MNSKVVSVVGLGYIGLPTAAVFASCGVRVIGLDIEPLTVETINRGEIHIIEPGLETLVCAAVKSGFLRATSQAEPADAFLIAVPTPFKGNHEPDLSCIEAAGKAIAGVLKTGDLVILESTSPVGATEQLANWLAQARPDLTFPQSHGQDSDIRIAYCPERVLPGQVLRELVQNDRVIGGMSIKCSEAACELYRLFVQGECIITDARTAEMCKLTENSFRDVNIAFANELSMICDRLNVDVWQLIRLANRHPRVNILQPGPGVGGHCIAVDPWFIVSQTPEQANLIKMARQVNDSKPDWVIGKVNAAVADICAQSGREPTTIKIACFGLAFKADIDDLRESPALAITLELGQQYRGQVLAVEPHIDVVPSTLLEANIPLVDFAVAKGADILLFLVDHAAFKDQEYKMETSQRVIDTRGVMKQ